MASAGDQETGRGCRDESYGFVTAAALSDRPAEGSYMCNFAACVGGHMPSTSRDWSALASRNERLLQPSRNGDTQTMAAIEWPPPPTSAARGARFRLRRGRAARGAVAGTVAVLAIAAATSVTAAEAQAATASHSW